MAITPVRLDRVSDGVTIHEFEEEDFIERAIIRQGSIRGRTRTTQTAAVARAGRSSVWGGRQWSGDVCLVDYWLDPSSLTTHEANLAKLEAVFPQDDDDDLGEVWFVIDEDGVQKRCLASIERLQPSDKSDHRQQLGHFVGVFTLLGGRWYRATAESVTAVAKSVSPATLSVAGGEMKSEEVTFTLEPTAAKSAANGQRFLRYINLRWTNPWAAHNHPVEVTDGGIDHAALVTATKSHSSGKDVELRNKGRRISRWSDNWNNAATLIWGNFDLPAARPWTLKTATTNSDTTWYFTEDLANMPTLPFHAWVDDEVVLVTAFDEATRTWTVDRAERGTSGAVHSAATKVYWLPAAQQAELVYGGTSLPTPTYIDDTTKPMINLATSTNTSFVLANFCQTDPATSTQARLPRSMSAYTLDVVDRGQDWLHQNYVPYTAGVNGGPADASPCTKMGIGYRSAGGFAGHPLQTAWGIRCAVGITDVQYTYWISILYQSGASARDGRLLVTSIDADGNRTVERTIAITSGGGPVTATVTDSPSPNAREIRWEFDPYLYQPTEPADGDGFDVDNVTLTLDLTEAVDPQISAEVNAYEFGRPDAPLTLANSDGKTLKLNMVVPLDTLVSLNVGERTITTPDGVQQSHLMSGDWPYLPKGTNNITLTESGIGTIKLGVSSYRKAWA